MHKNKLLIELIYQDEIEKCRGDIEWIGNEEQGMFKVKDLSKKQINYLSSLK